MTSTITTTLTLDWSGKAVFQSLYLSAPDVPDLFTNPPGFTHDPLTISPVTVDKAKFKYKKQIGDEICQGFFCGTVAVGYEDIDWMWDPVFEIDGTDNDKDGIEDYLEDIVGAMLDGAESGTIDIPAEFSLDLSLAAQSGRLAMGEITIDGYDLLNFYESCNFATDGNDVIFDEVLLLPDAALEEIKAEIIRMVEMWK